MAKASVTRSLLLEAAAEVIVRKGYEAASVDEIAERADVSKGVVYYHFKNKADVAQSLLIDGLDRLTKRFVEISRQEATAQSALTEMLRTFINGIYEHQLFGSFLLSEISSDGRPWSQLVHERENVLIRIVVCEIERAKMEGYATKDLDAQFAAVIIIGAVVAAAHRFIVQSSADQKDVLLLQLEKFEHRVLTCNEASSH